MGRRLFLFGPGAYNRGMADDGARLLTEALGRAKTLLERLIVEQAQIERDPPKIAPEALAEGRAAMAKAIAAARRTVEAIESALEVGGV